MLLSPPGQKQLILKGPLGANAATLIETDSSAVLTLSTEEPIKARKGLEITQRILGAPLDLTDLVNWLSSSGESNQAEKQLAASEWDLTTEKNSKNKPIKIVMKRKESYGAPAVTLILLPRY